MVRSGRRAAGGPTRALASARTGFALAALLSVAAVGAALFTQYAWDMQPCAWCVLQRVVFLAIALAALPGIFIANTWVRWLGGSLLALLAAAGMAAALWQHFVAASTTSCAFTLADRWIRNAGLDALAPQVFAAYANCAEAKVNLLGVPYEFYSLALFALLAGIGVLLVSGRLRSR